MDALLWEVVLPNGTVVRETEQAGSIRTAPRGATHLRIVDQQGVIVHAIRLDGTRPIFYRRRYRDNVRTSPTRTGATVFGWGRETDATVEGFVWAVIRGQVVDCPPSLRDQKMIELQVVG